ncbi:threonine synthase [Thermogladius sp. 4427co]|uniref:threonine synthase n=1 Tax=Thermogladius sp. 4427co TaxID=3450718 RepID=UPI003F7ABF60
MVAYWYCPRCGFREDFDKAYYWKCPRCGSPLKIVFEGRYEVSKEKGLARYKTLLPLTPLKYIGEGSTPLVKSVENGVEVWFKLEYLNPSGSFKDRGTSLALTYARKMGFKTVVDDSSGNTAISISLYSHIYGLKPIMFIPRTAPEGKKRMLRFLGAELYESVDRGAASRDVVDFVEKNPGVFYVAHTWSYFYILGAATIAYEVFEEAGVPDYVIAPIGSGGLILGLAQGFKTLLEQALTTKMPKIIGVQGYSVQPVSIALKGIETPGEASDLADGIMVPNPPRLTEIVDAIRESQGDVYLVGNSEIRSACNKLVEEGFLVEPTSAAPYAVLEKLKQKIQGKTVLIPLTGSGLKIIH